jgi:16S rRNA (cytosine1402-N4)-methyltransferase
MIHTPVLLNESISNLITSVDGIYVDATFGFGGHSFKMLELFPNIRVIGIDQDEEALNLSESNDRLSKINSNFSNLDVALSFLKIDKVSGILADIGLSSFQIDNAERGFSYIKDGPLDMRMNKDKNISAEYIVNNYEKDRIADIIFNYGEDRGSRRIASFICEHRKTSIIKTTTELSEIVKKASRSKGFDSVKRVFQALRIEVNNELENLKIFLQKSLSLLLPKGRLAIITFHSLEDRIVKEFFKNSSELFQIHKKVISPSDNEIIANSRSKSAKLRVAEKI